MERFSPLIPWLVCCQQTLQRRKKNSVWNVISSAVMAALARLPFMVLFACSWIFVLCQETQELKVTTGDNATLQCRGRGAAIEVIKWSRTDLKSDDGVVFFFRDGRSYENLQHPSFRGRVELRDPEMKDGDASVILKNVTFNDTGTYECRVKKQEENKTDKATLINTIILTVTEPGHTAGHKEGGDEEGGGEKRADTDGGDKEGGGQKRNVGPMVGLPVFAVLLVAVAVVGTMIFKKRRGNTAHPGGENAEGKQLTQEERQTP